MIRYSLGFIFNKNLSKVLLIHKNRPQSQKGKLNGLGGKFEESENCFECVSREVQEESGLSTNPSDWQKIGEMHFLESIVYVLSTIYTGQEKDAQTTENQKVEWIHTDKLPSNAKNNLPWLIPLCKDKLQNKEITSFLVKHNS